MLLEGQERKERRLGCSSVAVVPASHAQSQMWVLGTHKLGEHTWNQSQHSSGGERRIKKFKDILGYITSLKSAWATESWKLEVETGESGLSRHFQGHGWFKAGLFFPPPPSPQSLALGTQSTLGDIQNS